MRVRGCRIAVRLSTQEFELTLPQISVVILTLDEEVNIVRAVRSARLLSDDVLVIDSGSTDRTVELARENGAVVICHPFESFAGQRNAALDSGRLGGRFALFLDADEAVTPEFARALEGLLAADPEIDAVQICRKLHFWGRWVPAASSYPCYIDRVARAGAVRFRQTGHGEAFDGARHVARLEEPLHDEDAKGVGAWIERHNRYAEQEARAALLELAAGERKLPAWKRLRARLRTVPGWPVAALFYYWIVRGGLLEGRAGRTYSVMKAMYEYFVQLHLRDLRRRGWPPAEAEDRD